MFRSLFLWLILLYSGSLLAETATLNTKRTSYTIAFDSETVSVGGPVQLTIKLFWDKKDGNLKVNNFRLPVKPWYKFQGGGSAVGSINSDTSFYRLDLGMYFNQVGTYSIHPIEIFYTYDSVTFGKLTLTSPEITVKQGEAGNPIAFLRNNAVLMVLIGVFLIIIIWSAIRYRNLLHFSQYSGEEVPQEFLERIKTDLDRLFDEKKINYSGSVKDLRRIIELLEKRFPEDSRLKKIKNDISREREKNFVNFNTFETIYYALYEFVEKQFGNELNGGVNGDGHSKNQ